MKYSIMIVMLIYIMLFTACLGHAVSSSEVLGDANDTPGFTAAQEEAIMNASPAENPAAQSSLYKREDAEGFSLKLNEIDSKAGIREIEASASYDNAGTFTLRIVFTDERIIQKEIHMDLIQEDYFSYVDVTGDGYPEIVFPSLGYENSKGLSAPRILKIEEDRIVELPLFTINEGSGIFKVQDGKKKSAIITMVSKHTDKKYDFEIMPLCEQHNVQVSDLRFVSASTGVYSCDIWHIEGTKYGLLWKSFIELWFEIDGRGEPYAEIEASIISQGEYKGGQWVVTESIQRIDYR